MTAPAPLVNDLDDYDYEAGLADLDLSIPEPQPAAPRRAASPPQDTLGLDEEVKVRKKRINVRLNDERLLGPSGLPKLRAEAPKRIKFKHPRDDRKRARGDEVPVEYENAARLLSYYQLWADDLFKKAKFRDTVKIIEKLGHTRTIQEVRRSYIDEARMSKNKEKERVYGDDEIMRESGAEKDVQNEDGGEKAKVQEVGTTNDDDLYAAPPSRPQSLKAANGNSNPNGSATPNPLFLGSVDDDSDENFGDAPDDDELDALMDAATVGAGKNAEDEFEDDMDALMSAAAEEAERTTIKPLGKPAPQLPPSQLEPPVDDFEDEMEALRMGEAK